MTRLPKGLFRRPNGSYSTRDRRGGADRWTSFGTDLRIALTRFRAYDLDRDRFVSRGLTIGQIAGRWLETYIATARNTKGQQLAACWVRRYLTPAIGWKLAGRMTPDDFRAYRLWLEERSLSPETVAHILSDVRCLFRWAREAGYVADVLIPRRLLPKRPKRLPDVLLPEEIARLVAIPDPHGFVVRLGLGTGLRWGDLTRLRADHVRDGMLEVEIAKTGEVRRLPLRPEIALEIRQHVGRLVPFSPNSHGSFNRIVRQASGVERFHAHQLRHTCATTLLREGWPISAVQVFLGHTSVTTTERYAQFMEGMMREEANRRWGSDYSENR